MGGHVLVGGGDVGPADQAQQADRQAAQGGHDPRGGSGADPGGVLGVGDVADLVDGLGFPLAADQGGEFGGGGVVRGEAGDAEHSGQGQSPAGGVADLAFDQECLAGVGEAQVLGGGEHPDGVGLDASPAEGDVGVVRLAVLPGQQVQGVEQ